jgi:transcriptional regulator with XRE-family HTH domain
MRTSDHFGAQVRAAKALLKWDIKTLAEHSGIHRNTISKIENGGSEAEESTRRALTAAFERKGVELFDINEAGHGPGVRFNTTLFQRAEQNAFDRLARLLEQR